jgi:hypothetical protein
MKFDKEKHMAKIKRGRRKRVQKERPPEKIRQPSPAEVRHLLVLKYNQLIREGDPATKKLRRQIHEQISEIESGS